jgi:hypothetical protein
MTNYKNTPHSATGPSAAPMDAGAGNLFRNYAMKVTSNAPDCVVALETSPDGTTWTEMARVTGDGWCIARSDHKQRQARSNAVSPGTGGLGLSAVVTSTP